MRKTVITMGLFAWLGLSSGCTKNSADVVTESPHASPEAELTEPTVDAISGLQGLAWAAKAKKLTKAEQRELSDLTPSMGSGNYSASWNPNELWWEEDYKPEHHGPRAILPVEEARRANADRIRRAKGTIITTRAEWRVVAPDYPNIASGASTTNKDGETITLELNQAENEAERAAEVANYIAWRSHWHWPTEFMSDPRDNGMWMGMPYNAGERETRKAQEMVRLSILQKALDHEPWRTNEVAILHSETNDRFNEHVSMPRGILYRENGRLYREATARAPSPVRAITRAKWIALGFPEDKAVAGWSGKLTWLTVETKDGTLYRLADGEDVDPVADAAMGQP